MKVGKLLFLICAIFITCTAIARTINWYVDDQIYQTTTCESGNDITPPTPPAKHGYTFSGWLDANLVIGSWTQSGTPSPTNPVYPTFYQNGNLILRAVGTGNKLVADTYNIETGKIIRRIGVKVLTGTENWSSSSVFNYRLLINNATDNWGTVSSSSKPFYCSHCVALSAPDSERGTCFFSADFGFQTFEAMSTQQFKSWLAQQYANGTPVTVYYSLTTPTEENYTPVQ